MNHMDEEKKLEKTQDIMGWIIAGLIPLAVLTWIFPSLNRLFAAVFIMVAIFLFWEQKKLKERAEAKLAAIEKEAAKS